RGGAWRDERSCRHGAPRGDEARRRAAGGETRGAGAQGSRRQAARAARLTTGSSAVRISVRGVGIEVDDQGLASGKPLLLIMGLGMQLTGWPDELVQRLV